MILGAAGVALAMAAGTFAAVNVFGEGSGAGSPEAAARSFVNAVEDQDVVGALRMVMPGEASGLIQAFDAVEDRAGEAGLLSGGSGLTRAVSGSIDGLELGVEKDGDHAALVYATAGTVDLSYDPAEVPEPLDGISEVYEEPESETYDVADLRDDLEDDCFDVSEAQCGHLVNAIFGVRVLQYEGSWYVSVLNSYLDWTTAAYSTCCGADEQSLTDYRSLDDRVESGPEVASPEDLVDRIQGAVQSQDVDDLLGLMTGSAAFSLRPYADTLEDELSDPRVSVALSDVEAEAGEDDGQQILTIESAHGSYSDDYDSGEATLDGDCVTASDYESEDRLCDVGDEYLSDLVGPDASRDVSGWADSLAFVVVQEDGNWRLDPMASVARYIERMADRADADTVLSAIDYVRENN